MEGHWAPGKLEILHAFKPAECLPACQRKTKHTGVSHTATELASRIRVGVRVRLGALSVASVGDVRNVALRHMKFVDAGKRVG